MVSVSCIMALLIIEYRFFKHEAEKMIVLKEDYNNHLVAVSKVLHEYNKTKERLEQLEQVFEQEKKKSSSLVSMLEQHGFAQGARVFSSDDEPDVKDSFITINRELEYLKQSSLDYLKEQNLDWVVNRIGQYEWSDYTDQVLERSRSKKVVQHRKHKPKVVSGKRRPERLAAQLREVIRRDQKYHDIIFNWPIKRADFWLSSFFGPRKKANGAPGFHYGLDMAAVRGTPVYPVAEGVVVEARYASGYGKTVVIAHNRKYRTRYAHLDAILVKVGQKVTYNDTLGRVGSTGHVRRRKGRDGSHLHLEVSVWGKKINPMYFFS